MTFRFFLAVAGAAALALGTPQSRAQFATPPPAPLSAATIPAAAQMQAPDLVQILQSKSSSPVILQVGSRVFFAQAHIPGSQYVGPGSQSAGLQALDTVASSLAKDRFIVLYCGCCPWNRCPNVGPAYKHLHDLGFTNVKVLYLANNFGDDWVKKGYPTEHR